MLVDIATFALPLNEVLPVTVPVREIFRAVVKVAALVAVEAFPVRAPEKVGAVTVPVNVGLIVVESFCQVWATAGFALPKKMLNTLSKLADLINLRLSIRTTPSVNYNMHTDTMIGYFSYNFSES